MTRHEKIIQCLEGLEEGQIKLQEHIQVYGTTAHSELLAWICAGLRLVLESELRYTPREGRGESKSCCVFLRTGGRPTEGKFFDF